MAAVRDGFVLLRVNLAERRLLEAAAVAASKRLATWTRDAAITAARDTIARQSTGEDE